MEMGQPGIATWRGLIFQHGSELQVGFYWWEETMGVGGRGRDDAVHFSRSKSFDTF
jgi:hypothetical protein